MTRFQHLAVGLAFGLTGLMFLASADAQQRQNPLRQVPATSHRAFGFVPKHERSGYQRSVAQRLQVAEPTPAAVPHASPRLTPIEQFPTDTVYEEIHEDFEWEGNSCDSGACGSCRVCIPCPLISLENMQFASGVQAASGPLNRGQTGSFGFRYGLNYSVPLACLPHLGWGGQLGVNVIHSSPSGAEFTRDSRDQVFVTGGLFRRVDYGLQGGVALDYLSDDWYRQTDLLQVRAEASWVMDGCNELGAMLHTGTRDSTSLSTLMDANGQTIALQESFETTDWYAVFLRRQWQSLGAESRTYFGFSSESEGVVGSDFRLPLSNELDLQTSFTYLIPEPGRDSLGHREESWNVGLQMVWYPGCRRACGPDYYRPLFNVADNGSMLIRRP